MRLHYPQIFKRRDWRRGDLFTQRMIEIRYSVASAVRAHRKQAKLSQKRLAFMLDRAPSTISAIEQASPHVSLDQAVRALIVLGADDDALATAFNPGLRRDVQILRRRANTRFFSVLYSDVRASSGSFQTEP